MTAINLIKFSPVDIEQRQKTDLQAGDTVRVWQRIKEKDKTRLQAFEGLIIARKHGTEPGATFTVRRVTSGIGVEKTFLLYSPVIEKIDLMRRSKVRRAKLYYIRDKAAKEIRRKMKQLKGEAMSAAAFTKPRVAPEKGNAVTEVPSENTNEQE
ncbi:MAG: 50S ribosomal protein L19 [Candidatus Niyogibacteria bacterium]|nr:50S ribosomal protein L19 [Candidatus Niyogibacteria bacterium]